MSHSARTRSWSGQQSPACPAYPAVSVPSQTTFDPNAITSLTGRSVHMIGMGGCGMRGAAALLLHGDTRVSGSDQNPSTALNRLAELGATIHIGQSIKHIPADCDVVVHSAAIKDDNLELAEARQRGIPTIKYAELLGILMASRTGVAVAGTHGKSSTTAMTSYVLKMADKDPSYVIGAGVEQLGGGSGVGDGDAFIVEACEFDRSYLSLRPKIATILNVEEDHLDYYSGLDEIVQSFRDFASLIPADGVLIVNGEDRNALRAVEGMVAAVETFGFGDDVDYRAEIIGSAKACPRFRVWHHGKLLFETKLSIPGRHNIANALATTAICMRCGMEPESIAEHLSTFRGAYRRLTERGCVAGVTVVDDYGHHPTELQTTLKAAREFYEPKNMYVVFQPHQHSRTRFLLNDFAKSFGQADVVIVPEIYFVRDSEQERDLICAQDLVDKIHLNGGDARHVKDFSEIAEQLCREVSEGDLVMTTGAGNVWQIADMVLEGLSQSHGEDDVALAGDSMEY